MPIISKAIPKINNALANCQCIILNRAPKIVITIPTKNKTKGILYNSFIFKILIKLLTNYITLPTKFIST